MIMHQVEFWDGTIQEAPLGGRFVYNAARLLGYDVPLEYFPFYDDVDYTDTDVLCVDADDFRNFPAEIWDAACDVLSDCAYGEKDGAAARLRVLAAVVLNAEE